MRNCRGTLVAPNVDRTTVALSAAGTWKILSDGGLLFISENGGAWARIGTSGGGWQLVGTTISEVTTTNQVVMGAAAAPAAGSKLFVQGDADPGAGDGTVRLRAKAAQTGALFQAETSAAGFLWSLDPSGNVRQAGSLTPNADAAQTVGTTGAGGRIFASAHAVAVATRAAAADANANAQIGTSSLQLGLGGASALDWQLARSAVLPASTAAMGNGQLLDALGVGGFEVRSLSADANPQASLLSNAMRFGAGGAFALDVGVSRTGSNALAITATSILTQGRRRKLTITPPAIAANTNDYALLAGAELGVISSTGAFNLTGIGAGLDGDVLELFNANAAGGAVITLTQEDAASTAANRFALVGSVNLAMGGQTRVTFRYVTAVNRWVQWTALVSP